MDQITFNLMERRDGRVLGEVTITRGLEFFVKAESPEDQRAVESILKNIFSRGVQALDHTISNEKNTWITRPIEKDSPVFFETAIAMIERAGFWVRFPESEERAKLTEKIKKYCAGSSIEPAYKRLIEQNLPQMTPQQLQGLIQTFEKEYKDLDKK